MNIPLRLLGVLFILYGLQKTFQGLEPVYSGFIGLQFCTVILGVAFVWLGGFLIKETLD